MNSKYKSLIDFVSHFNSDEVCRKHFESVRFSKGESCAHCGHHKIYRFDDGKRFRCASCKKDFTIKTNTIFGESKISLQKWYIAIYLLTTSTKGISSVQLAKHIGVTQKTAWFMDQRLREVMKKQGGQLFGAVEADETYIGGREKNKHAVKRTRGTQGRNTKTKTAVMGLIERKGEVTAKVVPNVKMRTIEQFIVENVGIGSTIYSDEFRSYSKISTLYPHKQVIHGRGIYVDGEAHTNSIESFWALFKRGHYGTYHYMSKKHLQRYVDEFVYRFNARKLELFDAFAGFICNAGTTEKLTYKALTK